MPSFPRWATLTFLACCAPAAMTEDYRAEARISGSLVDNDGVDGKSIELEGTYYFGDVGTDGVPLAEAAFLGRDSMMSLRATRGGADGDYRDFQYLNTEIYIDTSVPLFLTAGIQRYETLTFDPETLQPRSGHDTAWDAGIGVTPLDGLRVVTRFYQGNDYDPNVDIKYVGAAGERRWFGIGVNLQRPDGGDLYWGVSADFFPDRTLRLGAAYENGLDSLWLLAEKFFTPRASVTAAYVRSDFADGFRIEGAWRF